MNVYYFILAWIVQVVGLVFAGAFIAMNLFFKFTDWDMRNELLSKQIKRAVWLSFLVLLISWLLDYKSPVSSTSVSMHMTYRIFGICWFTISCLDFLAILCLLFKRDPIRKERIGVISKMATFSIVWGIIFLLTSWLFS